MRTMRALAPSTLTRVLRAGRGGGAALSAGLAGFLGKWGKKFRNCHGAQRKQCGKLLWAVGMGRGRRIKTVKHRLFTILSALSLQLCVAVVVLWVRSYVVYETWLLATLPTKAPRPGMGRRVALVGGRRIDGLPDAASATRIGAASGLA
jgi:hypothetical protein